MCPWDEIADRMSPCNGTAESTRVLQGEDVTKLFQYQPVFMQIVQVPSPLLKLWLLLGYAELDNQQ